MHQRLPHRLLFSLSLLITLLTVTSASRDFDAPSNPLPCTCSDVDPRDDFTKANVPYSCWEQSGFKGSCDQDFMVHGTPEEVPEGYCQISCGRCDCCQTFTSLLQRKAKEFLWMANLTEYGVLLARPGYMATVLAPTDEAIRDLMNKWGYKSKQEVESSTSSRAKVLALVKLHILPPVADIRATWTTPFMRQGVQLNTEHSSVRLTADNTKDRTTIIGPKNSAKIQDGDLPVCKGFLNLLNSVLLPE